MVEGSHTQERSLDIFGERYYNCLCLKRRVPDEEITLRIVADHSIIRFHEIA